MVSRRGCRPQGGAARRSLALRGAAGSSGKAQKSAVPPLLSPARKVQKGSLFPVLRQLTAAQHIANADIHHKFLRRNGT